MQEALIWLAADKRRTITVCHALHDGRLRIMVRLIYTVRWDVPEYPIDMQKPYQNASVFGYGDTPEQAAVEAMLALGAK